MMSKMISLIVHTYVQNFCSRFLESEFSFLLLCFRRSFAIRHTCSAARSPGANAFKKMKFVTMLTVTGTAEEKKRKP